VESYTEYDFFFQASGFQNQFYKTYFLTIEQEIFAVLTDTFHKPGFKLHVLVLQHLFCVVCLYSIYSVLYIICMFSSNCFFSIKCRLMV
jgi:hypothetical protein